MCTTRFFCECRSAWSVLIVLLLAWCVVRCAVGSYHRGGPQPAEYDTWYQTAGLDLRQLFNKSRVWSVWPSAWTRCFLFFCRFVTRVGSLQPVSVPGTMMSVPPACIHTSYLIHYLGPETEGACVLLQKRTVLRKIEKRQR